MLFILSVVKLSIANNPLTLSVVMLSVANKLYILSVVMLSVFMLNVMAPNLLLNLQCQSFLWLKQLKQLKVQNVLTFSPLCFEKLSVCLLFVDMSTVLANDIGPM